ncbi:hypothetical protein [Azospirillum sp. SYSU D00513]|uniref:hypothetical protein n=1 Tax=Azospirillum sp. SYSU D00513 TaxID=2812561 RepID=UPI001A957761|nr:hypothetical protein [Azospirillum sp. SYSU D00513]
MPETLREVADEVRFPSGEVLFIDVPPVPLIKGERFLGVDRAGRITVPGKQSQFRVVGGHDDPMRDPSNHLSKIGGPNPAGHTAE